MTTKIETSHSEDAVYVYEVPLRLWHWFNALCIVLLCVTGYFIGSPLPALSGEASEHFLMGYIRFTHFASAYVLTVGFLFRLYWAFAGNEHARQLVFPPFLSPSFWGGVIHEIKWYAFLAKEPRKYVGHNPLAMVAMHIMLFWGTIFMICTGFAMYGEGAQAGYSPQRQNWFGGQLDVGHFGPEEKASHQEEQDGRDHQEPLQSGGCFRH